MKETRSDRFKRLAEARVNKLIAMVRLLGNLSNPLIYEYRPDQIVQIFSALQTELNRARNRFYQREGKRTRFSLSESSWRFFCLGALSIKGAPRRVQKRHFWVHHVFVSKSLSMGKSCGVI